MRYCDICKISSSYRKTIRVTNNGNERSCISVSRKSVYSISILEF